jgi:hypothetical protein
VWRASGAAILVATSMAAPAAAPQVAYLLASLSFKFKLDFTLRAREDGQGTGGTGVPRPGGLPPYTKFVCVHYTLVLIGSSTRGGAFLGSLAAAIVTRTAAGPPAAATQAGMVATAPPMGRPAGADPESPMPGHRGGNSRSRPNRDFGIPDSPIPGRIGNRPRPGKPESRKFSRSIPAKSGIKSGKISIFFAAARTVPVTAHCGTASGRPRLVQFAFPGRIGARRDGARASPKGVFS